MNKGRKYFKISFLNNEEQTFYMFYNFEVNSIM